MPGTIEGMAHYVHGHHESVLRSHRSRTAENSAGYLLPHLNKTQRLLDVGSGPGTITCDFTRLVAEVVALEPTADALALTQQEADRRGVTLTTQVGDVHKLPFDDNTFDVVHAHQVLQHIPDPVQALREMARITRPGGYVAVRDSDYSAFAWQPAIPELNDWLALYLRLARQAGGEPDAGRWLPVWAAEATLEDVTFTASTWCYASTESRAWWSQLWADRAVRSTFADDAIASGVPVEKLQQLRAGWLAWGESPTGLFLVPSVELLARVQ